MKDVFDAAVFSPINVVDSMILDNAGITLAVKREDLLHPTISGNKWRKLKYNLKYALDNNVETIITFGGAFSNHIYSTAAACKELGLKSVGLIRGDYDKNNPTTMFARKCGMELRFIDRVSYKEKEQSKTIISILSEYSNYTLIPEGGSNDLALKGLDELSKEINQSNYDTIIVSAGTGSTAAGILRNLEKSKQLWVFSSLKSDYLKQEILDKTPISKHNQLNFINQYHFGGYGKTTPKLIAFINRFKQETSIPIDPIYNGKLVAGFYDMVAQNQVDPKNSYLWIHTGGLQGITAYNYMAKKKNRSIIDC